MERSQNWYSVIRYAPDNLKGEVINVGLLLHEQPNKKIHFHLLDQNNMKLKSLLGNADALELYKIHKDYVEYYLEKTSLHGNLFDVGRYDNNLLSSLTAVFPDEIKLSEPTFSLTSNVERLFNNLLEIYIGNDFLKSDESGSLTIKRYVRDIFEDKNLIGQKIKTNARIQPIKDKESISYTVDFVYKNGVINFMQTTPSQENINNWFSRLAVFIDNYKAESVYHLLLDSQNKDFPEKTFSEMLDFLKSKNKNIHVIDIKTEAFEDLCHKIEQEGQMIEDFEGELNAV